MSTIPPVGPPPRPRIRLRRPTVVQCPHCTADNGPAETICASCGKTLAIFIGAPAGAGSYSLATIMGLIALISVGLGLMRAAPALGAFHLSVLTPAAFRTVYLASKERAWGSPLGWDELAGEYFKAAALFLLWYSGVGFVWFLAFMVFGAVFSDPRTAILVSAPVATVFAIWLARVFFKRRR